MIRQHKILSRLILYFSTTLLVFSLIIGGLFLMLFRNHTLNLQKAELEDRALQIATTLSEFSSQAPAAEGGFGRTRSGYAGGSGYGAYLRFLDDIAMTDVWIVDENMELLTLGRGINSKEEGTKNYLYSDLPKDADAVVQEVFQGKTTFSQGFSNLLAAPTLTVGTPIRSGDLVIGAVLLHAPVSGMNQAVTQGLGILGISLLIALVLSILVSAVFAVYFTRPLSKMRATAIQLAEGDYTVRTGVIQKDEIGELAESIDILSQRLLSASLESQKLSDLRREFVANISHELRTPVTVLRGSLEALYDQVITDPAQIKDYYSQMLQESRHLQRLVNDLLDLSRLQNTSFQIEREEISLHDLLQDAVHSASQIARPKDVTINLRMDGPDLKVTGDYGRLRQLLMILLDNAVKFSPAGSQVKVAVEGHQVTITDEGPGISQEDIPYIFERFYKTREETNKEGSGLGLSIARQISERHEIQLSAGNGPIHGAIFRLQFPIDRPLHELTQHCAN